MDSVIVESVLPSLSNLADGTEVAFANLSKVQKAILVHFWVIIRKVGQEQRTALALLGIGTNGVSGFAGEVNGHGG